MSLLGFQGEIEILLEEGWTIEEIAARRDVSSDELLEFVKTMKDDKPPMTVAGIAKLAGVSTSTIRLWSNQGLIQPERNEKGWRIFPNPGKTMKQIAELKEQ